MVGMGKVVQALAPLGKFICIGIVTLLHSAAHNSLFFNSSHYNHSKVELLVGEVDREVRLVFLHVPLILAQVHLFKPMVELVVNLVIPSIPNVVEVVVEEV